MKGLTMLAAMMALLPPIGTSGAINNAPAKSPLNKKQKAKRQANKRAKQARKNNR